MKFYYVVTFDGDVESEQRSACSYKSVILLNIKDS